MIAVISMPTALVGFSGNQFYEHRMWEQNSLEPCFSLWEISIVSTDRQRKYFSLKLTPPKKVNSLLMLV